MCKRQVKPQLEITGEESHVWYLIIKMLQQKERIVKKREKKTYLQKADSSESRYIVQKKLWKPKEHEMIYYKSLKQMQAKQDYHSQQTYFLNWWRNKDLPRQANAKAKAIDDHS